MTTSPGFVIASVARSHVGSVRKLNEDGCIERPEISLWAVADGMGGHQAGDLASRTIVESLRTVAAPRDAGGLITEVRTRLKESNVLLVEEAQRRGPDTVIGSTVVALMMHGGFFACLWAGDSRLYRMRDGALQQITRDHSQVQEMVDAGLLAAEAAEHHPYANVITRAVGTAPELELDKVSDRLLPGDLFLLCTDGLTKMVSDDEIAAILRSTPSAAVADALVNAALAHGGKDNVTAITVQVGEQLA